jgi:hypothetical protein
LAEREKRCQIFLGYRKEHRKGNDPCHRVCHGRRASPLAFSKILRKSSNFD